MAWIIANDPPFEYRNPKTLDEPAFCVTHDSLITARVAACEMVSLKIIQDIRRARAVDLMRDPSRSRNAIANLCAYASPEARSRE